MHDSAEAAERSIYLRSREKAAGILEWLQITDLSLGDQTGARIQLLACQSQRQLNYTLICFTKQPLWKMQSPAGPYPVAGATLCGHPHGHIHKAQRGRAAGGRAYLPSVTLRSSLALVPAHVTPKVTLGNTDKCCTMQVLSERAHTSTLSSPSCCSGASCPHQHRSPLLCKPVKLIPEHLLCDRPLPNPPY